MKKTSLLIISILLLFSFTNFSQDVKIGYTDPQYIITQLPAFGPLQSDLQAYQQQLENQLKSKETEIASKLQAFQSGFQTMTDIVRADKEQEIRTLQASAQEFAVNAQEAMQRKQQELLRPIEDKIMNAINVVAERENYTHIISNPQGMGLLLYSRPSGRSGE